MSVQRNRRFAGCFALTAVVLVSGCDQEVSAPRLSGQVDAPRFSLGPGQVIYIVEDVHPGGTGSSQAWAINNGNLITGWRDYMGHQQAYYRTVNGVVSNHAAATFAPYTSWGMDINDANVVVGSASNHAARWPNPSQIQSLTTPGKWTGGVANGINSTGYAVGVRSNGPQQILAAWHPNGVAADLISDENYVLVDGEATDINSSCKIVGRSQSRPFQLATSPCLTTINLYWLQLLPTDVTGGVNAINDAGAMVGYSTDALGFSEAALWGSATSAPMPIGMLPGGSHSWANDINEYGTIVGASQTSTGKTRAFRRRSGSGLLALPMLYGGVESVAIDLNDAGHSVGWVEFADRSTHAVAWWVYQAPHVLEPGMIVPPDPVPPSGMITVDLLSSNTFQPLKIELGTFSLGNNVDEDARVAGQKDGRALVSKIDVNKDGITDVRMNFYASDILARGDMKAGTTADLVLKGALRDRSKAVYGTVRVTISK